MKGPWHSAYLHFSYYKTSDFNEFLTITIKLLCSSSWCHSLYYTILPFPYLLWSDIRSMDIKILFLFSIGLPGDTVLLTASLCSLKFTKLCSVWKSSPPKSHLWAVFLWHVQHTKYLIISRYGLVICRDVMAIEEPLHFTVLISSFFYLNSAKGNNFYNGWIF